MRGDGRRADVHGGPVDAVPEAGPERDDVALAVHRGRHPPLAGAQGRLEGPEHFEAAAQAVEPPLLAERRLDAAQVAGRLVHVGRGHLDVAQPHHRVDADRVDLGPLAHDLAMDLAVGWDVDHDVSADPRRAAEAAARRERRPLLVVAPLDRPEFGEVPGPGAHPVLDELADALHHLAAPADPPPATHRIEVHPEGARGVEHRSPQRNPPPAPRGREDDPGVAAGPGVFRRHGGGGRCAGPAPRRCRAGAARGIARSSAGNRGRAPSARPRPDTSARCRRAGGS